MLVHYFGVILCVTFISTVIYTFSVCFDDENGLYGFFSSCFSVVHVKRLITAALISLLVSAWGLRRKSLDWTGAASGFFVGFILTFSSYCFLACLLTFFVSSSKATHFGSRRKKKFEADFKEGGQRNWIQVICNGGVAVELAFFYLLEGGVGEVPLSFHNDKLILRSWLATAFLSTLAGVNGDTWASELGTVLAKSEPRLITSFKKVPVGTNGGFTLSGLFYSALGGFVIGFAYFVALLLANVSANKIHQGFLLTMIGTFAGISGSVLDSVIGATLQYSGLEMRSGKVVEQPGVGVQHISGRPLLSNHSVNLIMSILNSVLVPTLILRFYPLLFS